jgi:DNA polymerase-3 subunit delta
VRDLGAFLARDLGRYVGLLVYGPDPAAVAERAAGVAAAVAGPAAEAESRLVRLAAARLRSDPAQLQDSLRARSFFPGRSAVVLDGAGDGLAPLLAEVLAAAEPGGDAFLVVTAEGLPARSKLRKLFEDARNAAALQLFDEPPGREEIAALLAKVGLQGARPQAAEALFALARGLDAGSLARLVERLALYKQGDDTPLTAADVAALAPLETEAGIDEAVAAAADGRIGALGAALVRLAAQGVAPVSLAIAAGRHFRLLHAAAVEPGGAEAALARARPPVWGRQRDGLLAQLRHWTPARLERAMALIGETDLVLRSGGEVPARALVERALLRIAHQRNG